MHLQGAVPLISATASPPTDTGNEANAARAVWQQTGQGQLWLWQPCTVQQVKGSVAPCWGSPEGEEGGQFLEETGGGECITLP